MSEHELWNELGNLYFLSGAYSQAVRAYNRSIEMDGAFGRPYSNLALTYVQQGRFDEAVDLYRRSIDLLAESKDKAITWNRLGNVYRYLKDYQQAVVAYRQADELDPNNGEGREEPGWLSDPIASAPVLRRQPPVRPTESESTLSLAETPPAAAVSENPAPAPAVESIAGWSADSAYYQEDISESLDPASLTTWGDPNQTDDGPDADWVDDPDPEILSGDVDGDDLSRWLPVQDEPQDLLDMVLDSTTAPPYLDEPDDVGEILEPFPFSMPEPTDEAAEMVVFPFAVAEQEIEATAMAATDDPTRALDVEADLLLQSVSEAEAAAVLESVEVAGELPQANTGSDDSANVEALAFAAMLPADEIPAPDVGPAVAEMPLEIPAEASVAEPASRDDESAAPEQAEISATVEIAALLPAINVTPSLVSEPAEQNTRQPAELDVIVQELPPSEFVIGSTQEDSERADDGNPQANTTPAPAAGAETQTISVTMTEAAAPERDAEEMHEIERGIAKFKRVVQVNPRNAHAWDALGNLYKAAGLYKEALLAYEQAISNDPSKALYHHHVGLVYACEGRTEEAIDAFQRVIEIDPDHSLAHATLGGYYRKMGLEELAQKHVGKAMKSIFDSENEYNRACLAAICGNTDQALDLLRVALRNKQTYVDWILRDPDLDFIRQDPRFKQLISDYAQ